MKARVPVVGFPLFFPPPLSFSDLFSSLDQGWMKKARDGDVGPSLPASSTFLADLEGQLGTFFSFFSVLFSFFSPPPSSSSSFPLLLSPQKSSSIGLQLRERAFFAHLLSFSFSVCSKSFSSSAVDDDD